MSRKLKLFLAAVMLATATEAQLCQAQPSAPMPPGDFVRAAAASDRYEIEAGRVAQIESKNPSVRAFAQQMIQDHTMTSHALQQAALASGMTPPMGLSDDGQKFLAQLQSLRGPDFDKAYARQQVLAHQQAFVVEQGYAVSGLDPNLKQAAQSAVPIIRHHLEMVRQLQP